MLNPQHLHTLHDMGIPLWQLRIPKSQDPLPETPDWEQLKNCVTHCTACPLHQTRTQTVFGIGDTQADLLIVGEAPGYYEDQQGEPFVGRAGQLLNAMLKAIGLERSTAYIANVLKCRPPQNRDPSAEEVAECTKFLDQQVKLIQPKVILAVGRIAAHYLLQTQTSMRQLRGQTYQFRDTQIPLCVTYHPAYLLRSPREKIKAFVDLLRVKSLLDHDRSDSALP